MPWPLPQPEMVNHCFGADLLDLNSHGCVLLHTSGADAPVSCGFGLLGGGAWLAGMSGVRVLIVLQSGKRHDTRACAADGGKTNNKLQAHYIDN